MYTEASYENSLIELFEGMGYTHVYGPDIERDYRSPLYEMELEDALNRVNPSASAGAIEDALYKLHNFENGSLVQKNSVFMDYLQNGINVSYVEDGEPFYCETLTYIDKLKAAGIDAHADVFHGNIHAFDALFWTENSKEARNRLCDAYQRIIMEDGAQAPDAEE